MDKREEAELLIEVLAEQLEKLPGRLAAVKSLLATLVTIFGESPAAIATLANQLGITL